MLSCGVFVLSQDSNILNNIFNNVLQNPVIFKNRDVLRHDFIPNYLPHRENQIIRIGEVVAPVLRGSRGSNLFIYGKTGTGKTAAVKYVLNQLLEKCHEIGARVNISYVNCRLAGTHYRVLARICESIETPIPFTGLATQEVFDRFKSSLEAKNLSLITVLDEIDALVKTRGDALLYELTRINESLNKSRVGIIGISNDLSFKEFLDPRVLSSLSEEEIVFKPYIAPELLDILEERSFLGFNKGVITRGCLTLCAALAAAEHGDARRALDLLRVAGEMAERKGSRHVYEDHVRYAQDKIEEDRLLIVLRTLPLHSKLVLYSTYLLSTIIRTSNGASTGDIYDIYTELCNHLKVTPLTQRRVSGLINELDITGILNAKVVSLGRYGRTKRVKLGISGKTLKRVYSEDEYLSDLTNFSLNNQ
jgi:cell division control protein 6